MRRHCWLLICAACGEVNDNRPADAPLGDGAGDDTLVIDAPPAAPGTIRWARSMSSLQGYGISDGTGGIVVTGGIVAPTNLGGDSLVPVGSTDMVVAGFDRDTAGHQYSVRFGAAGQEYAFLHSIDGSGAPYVNGVSYGDMQDLGLGLVTGGGGSGADGYIGRYGTAAPAWVQRIVGPGEDKIQGTALGVGATIYGVGWFEQSASFNGGTLTSTGGREIFIARFGTNAGAVDLTKTFGGTGRDEASSAASFNGQLIAAGFFDDTINFGGTTSPITSVGGLDVWVTKFDTNGNGVWAVRFGGTGNDREPRITVDTAGDVYIAGSFNAALSFGSIMLTPVGADDIFVAKLRGTDGAPIWAASLGAVGSDVPLDLSVRDGHVAIAGYVTGALAGELTMGGVDSLVATWDATSGAPGFRKVFSTSADERSFALTYGRNGDLYALVGIGGTYDFGVPLIGPVDPSTVLVRIAP